MSKNQNLSRSLALAAVLTVLSLNVSALVPRAEHPRPDLLRENRITLNGEWQFEIDKAADGESGV